MNLYCNKLFALQLINLISYDKIKFEQIRNEGYFGRYKGCLNLYISKNLPTNKPYAIIKGE